MAAYQAPFGKRKMQHKGKIKSLSSYETFHKVVLTFVDRELM